MSYCIQIGFHFHVGLTKKRSKYPKIIQNSLYLPSNYISVQNIISRQTIGWKLHFLLIEIIKCHVDVALHANRVLLLHRLNP